MPTNRHLLLILLAAATRLHAAEPPAPIRYELKNSARVSAAIYNAQGVMVRTLLNASPQKAGRQALQWDGLDAAGKPAPAGSYTWKLLESQGLQAEYLLALGTSMGLNHWPGQHGGPVTVACDGKAFITGGNPEGSPLLAKATLDGKFVWNRGQFRAPEGATDTAMDGDRVYSLQSSATMRILETATGAEALDAKHRSRVYTLTLPIRKLDDIAPTAREKVTVVIPGCDAPHYLVRLSVGQNEKSNTTIGCKIQDQWFGFDNLKPGQKRQVIGPLTYNNTNPVRPSDGKLTIEFGFKPSSPGAEWYATEMELLAPVERIDARDGALAALFPAADTLAWVEPDSGKILEQVKVADARDVTLMDARTALVISGDTVVKIGRDGAISPVIAGLTAPTRISWDAVTKTLFVVEAEASQQVKRFGDDFKLQAAFGRPGGRQMGIYRPENFLAVADIAADGRGGFVICENDSAPRRTAHFDRDGRLLREWYGGQQFYTFAAADPADPTLVWMDSQWGHLMQVKVDYAKRDWQVRACYRWGEKLDPMLFSHFKMARRMIPFRAELQAGKRELFLYSDAHAGLLLKVDEAAGLLRPVAGLGVVTQGDSVWNRVDAPEEKLPPLWVKSLREIGKDLAKNPDARRLYRGFAWADGDGSFDVAKGAMSLLPSDGHGFAGSFSGCLFLDSDFTIFQGGWSDKNGRPAWTSFAAQGRSASGAPVWDWAKRANGPRPTEEFNQNLVSLHRDAQGNTYTIHNGGGDGYRAMGTYNPAHGWSWPANQIDASAVGKWDKDGRRLWSVGPHAARLEQGRGQLHHPTYLAGMVNGALGVCDKIVSPCEFWSEDGLYIGGLLDRRADDGLPNRAYSWWRAIQWKGDAFDNLAAFQYDMILGGSLTKLPNGDAIFFGCGWNNVPVYRISGWDKISRQQGVIKVVVNAPHAVGDGQGLAAEYFANADFSGEPIARQTAAKLWFEPARKGFAWPTVTEKTPVAARWTGAVEPKFSEDYTLSIYAKGNVRLWLGGKLLLDVTNKPRDFHKAFAEPVSLKAGQRYAVQAEWAGPADGEFHLNWESQSQTVEHIPTTALRPEIRALPVVKISAPITGIIRPAPAELIIVREGSTAAPLTINLDWRGTALAGIDFQMLPAKVTIPAGKSEVRLPVRTLKSSAIAPTRDLLASASVSSDYLLDGTRGFATVSIRDGRVQPLKVESVKASGEQMSNFQLDMRAVALNKLIDRSGLDAGDPPLHDTNIANAWYADWSEPDRTVLTFDLGALCDLAELRVWNLNSRSAHGTGWGQGPTVRSYTQQIRVGTSESADGPWRDAGTFKLRQPSGQKPEPGELFPIGQRARFVQIHFARPHDSQNIGLAEVEFRGVQ